jgi:hypothetical protein
MLGEIFLYNQDGELIAEKKYYTVIERQKIMTHWTWAKDPTDYIQIYPVTNARQQTAHKYSNIPTYDYSMNKNGSGH